MINLGNYEEYFILYMDNELRAEERRMVDDFVATHPHLAEELEILMSTKLSVDEVSFAGKADLHSSAMKMNVVDESLLLYIDNELPAADKKNVEERLKNDKEYRLQHALLLQTKLDASEEIKHPNKKELYRHTERVVYLKTWMKVAVAVVIVLLASLYFILSSDNKIVTPPIVKIDQVRPQQEKTLPEQKNTTGDKNETADVTPENKTQIQPIVVAKKGAARKEQPALQQTPPNDQEIADVPTEQREVVRLAATKFKGQSTDIKIPFAKLDVTSTVSNTYNNTESPEEFMIPEGTEKKIPGKGFLRKVSRLIERRTGIAAVNDDNELLIGAVAIKLK